MIDLKFNELRKKIQKVLNEYGIFDDDSEAQSDLLNDINHAIRGHFEFKF